tara:strand:- start:129 stop:458 length:330 start_codon:yes stop_codon:yes gene_type:complete
MSNREISKEEARGRLEQAVSEVDVISLFLGIEKVTFMRTYCALHRQLRDGDRLTIEVTAEKHEGSSRDFVYPVFNIVFYAGDSQGRVIVQKDITGYGVSKVEDNLLYDD